MQRILVIGSGGSGKSTFARRLSGILRIDLIHLDSLYWKPGWIEPDKAEWADRVRDVVSRQSWILDGNYSGTLAERLAAADTVIFLDLPRLICTWRVLKRVIQHHGETRPDMPAGCPERLDLKFLLWVWNYPKRTRGTVLSLLAATRQTKNVVLLRTRTEVERFLDDTAAMHERARAYPAGQPRLLR